MERPGGPRPISITEAGTVLLRHADGIVARLRAAQADMAALADGAAGTLRVGTFQSVGARVLPEVIRRFASERPDVSVQLKEAEDETLSAPSSRGELDLTFIQLPIPDGPFEFAELMHDPWVLVVCGGLAVGSPRDGAQPARDRGAAADRLPDLHERPAHRDAPLARGLSADVVFRSGRQRHVQGWSRPASASR